MKKKIYFVQPTYRGSGDRLLQGRTLLMHSAALPALSATVPPDWEKEVCLEYFYDEVNYDTDASVVAISCMVYDVFRACEMIGEFRRRGKVVILGGVDAALWNALVRPSPNAIVYGNPGPDDMRRILDDVENDCVAPEYRLGMNVDFPFDYSVLAGRRILFLPVVASIGCAHRCEFCCTAAMSQGRFHLRSLDVVMEDLRALRRMTRRLLFVDSNIYNSRDHLAQLLERMVRERFGFHWGAECTASIGNDPEMLRLLRRAGCRLLVVGLESIQQDNLKEMRKPNVAALYREQLGQIRSAGIQVGGFFMFGFDGDDPATADALYAFIRETRVALPFVNLLTPIPGTRFFDRMKAQGRVRMKSDDEFLRQSLVYDTPMYKCYFEPKRMSGDQAERAFLRLRERLFSLPEILRRSLVPNPIVAGGLLMANLRFRAETRAIAAARRNETTHPS